MELFDMVRLALEDAVGTRGAVRNCRIDLVRRAETERAVQRLCDRIPAPLEQQPQEAMSA